MKTLVVSDVHISGSKSRSASRALASLLASPFEGGVLGSGDEVVFGGDVLDFDPLHGRAEPADAARAILKGAPELTHYLRKALERGTHVTFVAGNHDAALGRADVRRAIDDVLGAHEEASQGRVSHCGWFHRSITGAHVEHGHLYDPACAGDPEMTLGGVGARHAHLAFPGLDPEGIDSLPPSAYAKHLRETLGQDPARARSLLLAGTSFLRTLATVEEASSSAQHAKLLAGLRRAAAEEVLATGLPLSPAVVSAHLRLVTAACKPSEFVEAAGWEGYKEGMVEALALASAHILMLYRAPAVIFGHTHRSSHHVVPLFGRSGHLMNAGCWDETGGTYAVHAEPGDATPTGVYSWPP